MNLKPKKIYGLIGYPVRHSLSPAMHNAAFSCLEINAEYRLFEVKPEKLKGFLLDDIEVKDTKGETFHPQELQGFNITIPHKVRTLELARLIENITVVTHREIILAGAINTVKRENAKLSYYNTDITGFMKSLAQDLRFDSKGKNVFIFGCGGAGRAIIAGLTLEGSGVKRISIYDVNKEAMDSAQEHFRNFSDSIEGKLEFILQDKIPDRITEADLLINASPVGMKDGDPSVVGEGLLHKGLSVYDVVYNRQTQLIKDAESLGLPVADGRGMLLYQGAEAFKIWTGQDAPIGVMRGALEKELARC